MDCFLEANVSLYSVSGEYLVSIMKLLLDLVMPFFTSCAQPPSSGCCWAHFAKNFISWKNLHVLEHPVLEIWPEKDRFLINTKFISIIRNSVTESTKVTHSPSYVQLLPSPLLHTGI